MTAPARTTVPVQPPGPALESYTAREVQDAAASWALVLAAQAGDADAFGQLYARYLPAVFRFVYSRISNRQTAEDVTADTFLKAWHRIGSFTWQGRNVCAWFITIARNLVADYYKASRFRYEVLTVDFYDADHPEQLSTESPTEQALEAAFDVEQIVDGLHQLSDPQRQVLILRFLRGLSVRDTAQVMGSNEGAIKALQFRAVRAMARHLPPNLRDPQ